MNKKGTRYPKEKKQEVVNFVLNYNSENKGRGGVANASKKYNITAMTIKAWVDKFGGGVGFIKGSGKADIFIQLAEIQKQIEVKQAELSQLESLSTKLKAKVV